MLTEVMRFYGLARPPVDAGFFETEHYAQVARDIHAGIMGGRLIALTAVIGSGKTVLSRRLRAELEREGRIIVSRSLSIDKLDEGVTPDVVLTDEAATLLGTKLKTPLQIGQHLVRAFEAGFEIGAKPIAADIVETVLSSKLDELEPQLTRNGYDLRSLVEQFDAKPAEIRQLLRGDLDAGRA